MFLQILKERMRTFRGKELLLFLAAVLLNIFFSVIYRPSMNRFLFYDAFGIYVIMAFQMNASLLLGKVTFPRVLWFLPRVEKDMQHYIRCQILVSVLRILLVAGFAQILNLAAMLWLTNVSWRECSVYLPSWIYATILLGLEAKWFACSRVNQKITGSPVGLMRWYQKVLYGAGILGNAVAYLITISMQPDAEHTVRNWCIVLGLGIVSLIHVVLYDQYCMRIFANVNLWEKEPAV